MGKEHDKQAEVEDKKKKGADVDVDAEHKKDVSRKASNADLKRQAHINADSSSYSAVQAALIHFSKNLHDRANDIKDWTNSDTSGNAGAGPAVDQIQEMNEQAVTDAERIGQLLSTVDKKIAYTIAPEVKQAQGAAWIFYNQLLGGRNWIHRQVGFEKENLQEDRLPKIVEGYTAKIGVEGSMDQNRNAPEGDEQALRATAVKGEIDALEAAISSVESGNSEDMSRLVIHARYLDNFAREHQVHIKSHDVLKRLGTMKKKIDVLAVSQKDSNLNEASNHLRAIIHGYQ